MIFLSHKIRKKEKKKGIKKRAIRPEQFIVYLEFLRRISSPDAERSSRNQTQTYTVTAFAKSPMSSQHAMASR